MIPTVKQARYKKVGAPQFVGEDPPRRWRVLCGCPCRGCFGYIDVHADGTALFVLGWTNSVLYRKNDVDVWEAVSHTREDETGQRIYRRRSPNTAFSRNNPALSSEAGVSLEPYYNIERCFPAKVRCHLCRELSIVDTADLLALD